MPKESIFEVQAQEDFVEKLAAARPAQALAELVWNGLDAEATKVSIVWKFDRVTAFTGLSNRSVFDMITAHGIARKMPHTLFHSAPSADHGSGVPDNRNTVSGCFTGRKVRDVSVRSPLAESQSGP